MAALSHPVYRRLFAAQVVALAGTGLTTVALGLLAYDLTGASAGAVLGAVFAVKMVANILVAPVAAAVAARVPRRRLLVTLDLVRAAVALVLPWVDAVWQVIALVVVLQVAAAAFTPAYQAVIPTVLTDERDYTRALSLARLAYDLEGLLSPVLAAAVLSLVGFSWLFVGTALGFLGSAALVWSVRLPAAPAPDLSGLRERTLSGLRIYLHAPALRAQLGLNLAAACAGAMVLVNTVTLAHDLGGDDRSVALALAAFGGGSMVGALVLPSLLERLPVRRVMVSAAAALAAALLAATSIRPTWAWLVVLWVGFGVLYSLVLTPVGRLIRDNTRPDDLPAVFAAQFALSHAGWLVAYLVAGLGGGFAVLGVIAIGGLLYGVRSWHGQSDLVRFRP